MLTVLLALVGAVHAWGRGSWPPFFGDEGTYVAQSWSVLELQSLAPYTYWYDHPPLGWLVLAFGALVTDSFDRASDAVAAGRETILALHLVASVLLYAFARRLGFRRFFAAGAVLLFGLSPLAVYYQRMVLLDNLAVPWVLAAFVLALSPKRRLAAFGASGVTFACAILTKETLLILLPALLMVVWRNSSGPTRRFCISVFGALFVLTCSIYALYAALKSELVPGDSHVSLIGAVEFQLFSRVDNGSLFDPDSVKRRTVEDWLELDPWLLAAGLALTPIAVFVRSLRPVAVGYVLLVAIVARPGYLPNGYVVPLLPLAALIVAGIADTTWKWRPSGAARRRRRLDPARLLAWAPRVAIVGSIAVVLVGVGPRWARDDWRQMSVPAETPYVQTKRWILGNIERDRTLLVEEPFWLDLVRGSSDQGPRTGFDRDRVVWFYKLDLDPEIAAKYRRGWRDFDYVVTGGEIASTLDNVPQSLAALDHSIVVASFGTGDDRLEVRRIVKRPVTRARGTTELSSG